MTVDGEPPSPRPSPALAEDGAVWDSLRGVTQARIGLARSGASLGTEALLEFRMAHALARDAVHAELDEGALIGSLPSRPLVVSSAAGDRRTYLLRPDLGRRLGDGAAAALNGHAGEFDLVVVLGDGLSALALQRHAGPLLRALLPMLNRWRMAPLVLVRGARVAVGDAVAGAIGAGAVLMMLGERPGLSAPDSLGGVRNLGAWGGDNGCGTELREQYPTGGVGLCGGSLSAGAFVGEDAADPVFGGGAEGRERGIGVGFATLTRPSPGSGRGLLK